MSRSVRSTMPRRSPRAMECLTLLTLLGMTLPTAGDVFESSLDNLKSQIPFQCTKVTNTGCRKTYPEKEVILESLVASFGSDASCALNRSVGTLYHDLTYFFNDNCLTKPIKNMDIRLNMNQIISEASKSGCLVNDQKLSKLTVHYGCASQISRSSTSTQGTVVSSEAATSSRSQFTTAINTLLPIAITESSVQAVTQSLPPTTVLSSSLSTVKATFATTNKERALSTSTSVRPSTAWSTIDEQSETVPVTISGAASTSAGITVTWRLENSARTIINVADGTLNQIISTQPTNRTDFSSKAVTNSEEWWQFFKTNEGIAVAMASLLVICLAICGLAIMFCSRSKKGTESPGSTLPSGAFVATATHNGNARGVPNGKEHLAEPEVNARANLYVDAPGYRRPSSRPTSTSGVHEQPGTFPLPFSSSFNEPSRRQSHALGRNLANGAVAPSSPGSFREDDHYAAIGDATEMLRPVEERRASSHRPSVTGFRKPSAVEMTTSPTAGRGFGGMFAIEEEDVERASRAPPTRQLEHFRADVTQQFTANPQADQSRRASQYLPRMSWSMSAGPQSVTPANSFPVALNRRVSEMSMNTPM